MPSFLNLTRILILINAVIYCIELAIPEPVIVNFGLWPLGSAAAGNPPFEIWQLITYAFLHDPQSWTHILLNMWGLFMFGQQVEEVMGIKRYAGLYFSSVLMAGLTQLAFTWFAHLPSGYTVGASGAVFGVMLAFAVFFPKRIIVLIIPPIPLPARIFVVLYVLLELYLGVTGTQEGVAHFAHLGGLVGAIPFLLWRRR
ncbi:MAG: rhomboid family intrarane serine protease [Betaproteobacteria bacterium]|nr:rhomboid family intrarane serine protease [Betaproteobacteria bacterium]